MNFIGINAKLEMHFKKNKKNRLKLIKLFNKNNVKLIQKRFEEDFVNFDYNLDFNKLKFFLNYG